MSADGRLLGSYRNSGAYPNYEEWKPGSGLGETVTGNAGTAPAFFKVLNATGYMEIGTCNVNIPKGSGDWDSKMGVIIGSEGPIEYTGKAWGYLKPGDPVPPNVTIDFDYCYY